MRRCLSFIVLLMSLLGSGLLSAFSFCPTRDLGTVYIGPEVYHLHRSKKGGSWQSGWLYGGRSLYERRIPFGLYWALEGYYAYGHITGKSSSGRCLKSHLTESEIEGRIGASLCFKICPRVSITPYGGYGVYDNKNDFKHPSPIPCKFHDRIDYAAAGGILTLRLKPCLEASIDFKVRYMLNGKSYVSHDPDQENTNLKMNNEFQYDVAVPIIYQTCWKNRTLKIYTAPFYRFRHFGGMFNFPYDFVETKLKSYGLRVMFALSY